MSTPPLPSPTASAKKPQPLRWTQKETVQLLELVGRFGCDRGNQCSVMAVGLGEDLKGFGEKVQLEELLQKLDLFKSATTAEARSGRRNRLAPFANILSHLGMLDECCSAAIPESEDTQKEEEEKVVEYKSFLLCEGQDGTPIWAMSAYLGLGGDMDLWKRSMVTKLQDDDRTLDLQATYISVRSSRCMCSYGNFNNHLHMIRTSSASTRTSNIVMVSRKY
ncbi:hypothetical protein D8674_000139 [Pyrus ussuriensis x Pyrus communis]|uniref:Uncharacterized protein n=1 Tax=Pyrus ussuriensis x Pyrus communis TaxID=2448454 RepID=A0A5N5F292_9ROSA|nr:hypothetical protein D8674_000139 [Pyrus ussuriensis x Pyrus communis]